MGSLILHPEAPHETSCVEIWDRKDTLRVAEIVESDQLVVDSLLQSFVQRECSDQILRILRSKEDSDVRTWSDLKRQ